MDWFGKLLNLPQTFLSTGGGTVRGGLLAAQVLPRGLRCKSVPLVPRGRCRRTASDASNQLRSSSTSPPPAPPLPNLHLCRA